MNNLPSQISNPQGIDFQQSLKDWVKIDYLKENTFFNRKAGLAALITTGIICALLVGGVIMNLGAILFWIGSIIAKLIIAGIVAVIAILVLTKKSRSYIQHMVVGFFETITLEYVRKHPLISLNAFWAFIVNKILNLRAAIDSSKTFLKNSLDREIDALTERIESANQDALKAEGEKDDIKRNSYLNMATQLGKTKSDYIQLKMFTENCIAQAQKLLKVAESKKVVIENDIAVYKTKNKFNAISSDLISTMRGVLFPDQQILGMYQEAKQSIDQQFDSNLTQMDSLMEQFNMMPSAETFSNPTVLQSTLKQFEEWKVQSGAIERTSSVSSSLPAAGGGNQSQDTGSGIRFD